MLSTLSTDVLRGAILREESAVLQRVPGIGKKTSERIMFHLRDKLDFTDELTATPFIGDEDGDVIDILTGLGFSIVEAQSALQNIPPETASVDARVQAALQHLDRS
jgi:Holliday junction DNA helicase RuvA